MANQDAQARHRAGGAYEQLIAVVGEKRYHAEWTARRQCATRLQSQRMDAFGVVFALSAGAGAITAGAGATLGEATLVALLLLTSAFWLVAAIYALGDVSAHFNPAMNFVFALRGDMHPCCRIWRICLLPSHDWWTV